MDKILFPELKGKELIEMLEANSDGAENLDYSVKLEEREITELKTDFAQKSIEEARLIDAFKELKNEHKAEIKPLTEEKNILLNQIKTGGRSEFGKCYKLVDHTTHMAGYYNNRGQLVYSRPVNEDERGQLTITKTLKTGTNDK